MRFHWLLYALYPFTLVNTIAGLALALVYRPVSGSWRWRAGCLEVVAKKKWVEVSGERKPVTRIWGRPGGQALGCPVIWFADEYWRGVEWLQVHERVHVYHGAVVGAVSSLIATIALLGLDATEAWIWTACLLGAQLVFGISYGLHFLIEWARIGFSRERWKEAYARIWTERIAHRIQEEVEAGLRPGSWGDVKTA